jgi:hypothetical protein
MKNRPVESRRKRVRPQKTRARLPRRKQQDWYAVKCLFEWGRRVERSGRHCYEERIVLIRAVDEAQAVQRAEAEAQRYAGALVRAGSDGPAIPSGIRYAGITNYFHLFDSRLTDGTEVYSVLHDSQLPRAAFIRRRFSKSERPTKAALICSSATSPARRAHDGS